MTPKYNNIFNTYETTHWHMSQMNEEFFSEAVQSI